MNVDNHIDIGTQTLDSRNGDSGAINESSEDLFGDDSTPAISPNSMNVDNDIDIGTQIVNSGNDDDCHSVEHLTSLGTIAEAVDVGGITQTVEEKAEDGDKATQFQSMAPGASSHMMAIDPMKLYKFNFEENLESITDDPETKSEASDSSDSDNGYSQIPRPDIAMTGIKPIGICDEELNRFDQFIFHNFVKGRSEKRHINFFSEKKMNRVVEVEMEEFIQYYDLAVRFANITFGRIESAPTRAILRPVGYGTLV